MLDHLARCEGIGNVPVFVRVTPTLDPGERAEVRALVESIAGFAELRVTFNRGRLQCDLNTRSALDDAFSDEASAAQLARVLEVAGGRGGELAAGLRAVLVDPGSFAGFHAVGQRAYRGEIDLDALADAYRPATGPAARNRGAIFMHAIKRISRSE